MDKNINKFKIHSAILKWCEDDDESEIIRYKIHSQSQPSKYPFLRKSLRLSTDDINHIRKIGLIKIRELAQNYIQQLSMVCTPTLIKFPILNALYANGLCCRECMSVCYKINQWKELSEKQKDKMIMDIMKWIHMHYTSGKGN